VQNTHSRRNSKNAGNIDLYFRKSALAQEESDKRSDRVKKAYASGKYDNWGKPGTGYSDEEIIEVYQREGSLRKARLKLPYETRSVKGKFVRYAKISQIVRTT